MTLFSISQYIKPWLLPPGINIFLMLMGFFLRYYWRYLGRICSLLGFLSLWLLSMPIVAYNLVDILQRQYPLLPQVITHSPTNAAIVVLGGGDTIEAEYSYKPTVSDFTMRRLKYAVHIHQQTQLPIIVSGGKTNGAQHAVAELMANVLQDTYHLQAAYKEDKSLTTADESKYIAALLEQQQIKEIYLVTNAWHMPRSVYAFRCAGVNVIPAPMGYYLYGPGYSALSFLPSKEALYASAIALHEFIGIVSYRFFYGAPC